MELLKHYAELKKYLKEKSRYYNDIDSDDINQRIIFALNLLTEQDKNIIDIDVNERSITHRLGLYLELLFPTWDVDCEYNRMGDDGKSKVIDSIKRQKDLDLEDMIDNNLLEKIYKNQSSCKELKKLLNNHKSNLTNEELINLIIKEKKAIPDIIIHSRRDTLKNLTVIEVKKSDDILKNKEDLKSEFKSDYNKLVAYKDNLSYENQFFITINVSDDSEEPYQLYSLFPFEHVNKKIDED